MFKKKKETITFSQYIFLLISNIFDNVYNMSDECLKELSDNEKIIVEDYVFNGSIIYSSFLQYSKYPRDGEYIGKTYMSALIYYYQKQNYNNELIEEKLDIFSKINDGFEYNENLDTDIYCQLYIYINKIINEKFNKFNISLNSLIASYSKQKFKNIDKINEEIMSKYIINFDNN